MKKEDQGKVCEKEVKSKKKGMSGGRTNQSMDGGKKKRQMKRIQGRKKG